MVRADIDDDDLAAEMAGLIYERTQMTEGDADDLAWDLLQLIDRVGGR